MNEENIFNEDKILHNIIEEIPIKKKRGRKPKIKTDEEPVIKEKKKRGRKPKIKTDEPIIKVYKKRGRKPTGKIIDSSKISLSSVEDDDDCIIAHIPIQLSNIDKYIKKEESITENKSILNSETEYTEDNNETEITDLETEKELLRNSLFSEVGVNREINNSNSEYLQKLEERIQELKIVVKTLKDELQDSQECNFKNINIYNIDVNIIDRDGNNLVLTETTDISCWWCSCQFDTTPIFLPYNYHNNIYHALGCFCSFNCAMAYNIDINDYKIWIRSSYLHKLYREMTNNLNEISPSLPRQALKKYGGWLTIEEFRKKLLNINKEYRHIIPPMVPIVSIIEECSKSRNRNKNYKIELNNQKVLKANENLKLRRNKPLPSSKNSLEKTMGLKRINNII